MEPTRPSSPQGNLFGGDPGPDATNPGATENERTRLERGTSNLSGADPLDNTRPGPMLAYVRPSAKSTAGSKTRAVWPRRLMLVIFVVFCMEVGIMLAVLPWKQVWISNPLVLRYPDLRAFLGNYFVRGLFTGLGLIDLWLGIWEAVHYSEE